jgi:hypothetical protein
MEFHPITLLNTTHKITSIIANFMGINKLSQSILPLFLPVMSGTPFIPAARPVVNRKIMADFRHSPVGLIPGRALVAADPKYKIPENWYSSREFGSFTLRAAGIARCARCPQVIHILLWITLVEFGSFSVLVAQRCSSRFERILSLVHQP